MIKFIKKQGFNLLLMLQYMTRVTIKKDFDYKKEDFNNASIYMPIIGLIIGFIQWLIYILFYKFLPQNVVSVFVILTGIIINGGLCINGLGATCDGLFSFENSKINVIKEENRIGTFACIAIVTDIVLKYSLISTQAIYLNPLILLTIPVLGKFSILFLCFIGKKANNDENEELLIENIGEIQFIVVLIITAIICISTIGTRALIILPCIMIITGLFYLFSKNKIDGINSDSLGASNEIIEILVLILIYIID